MVNYSYSSSNVDAAGVAALFFPQGHSKNFALSKQLSMKM